MSSLAADRAVETRVNDREAMLFVTLKGTVTGREVAGKLASLYLARPEVTGYDMLFNLSEYAGTVTAEDVEEIVRAYLKVDPDHSRKPRTAFITPDRNFHLWAAAMTQQFNGRVHRAFDKAEDAIAFLETPRDAR